MATSVEKNKTKLPEGFPSLQLLMWETLEALKALGGSATRAEIEQWKLEKLKPSEEILSYSARGKQSRYKARSNWALSFLKFNEAAENSTRGVWSITPKGRDLLFDQMSELEQRYIAHTRKTTKESVDDEESEPIDPLLADNLQANAGWREVLTDCIQRMTPDGFERLCHRILRESGFTQVIVTGRTGDQGIDGRGVLRVGLVSFHVLFQCKRYKGTVGAGEVRDFRGAMSGRTDKGLLMTTGRFTPAAIDEANREGAPPIELIDGDALIDLLKSLEIGVKVEKVEVVNVNGDYFQSI